MNKFIGYLASWFKRRELPQQTQTVPPPTQVTPITAPAPTVVAPSTTDATPHECFWVGLWPSDETGRVERCYGCGETRFIKSARCSCAPAEMYFTGNHAQPWAPTRTVWNGVCSQCGLLEDSEEERW